MFVSTLQPKTVKIEVAKMWRNRGGDLIQTYKTFNDIDEVDITQLNLTRHGTVLTRFLLKYSHTNIGKFSFTNRAAPCWNADKRMLNTHKLFTLSRIFSTKNEQ